MSLIQEIFIDTHEIEKELDFLAKHEDMPVRALTGNMIFNRVMATTWFEVTDGFDTQWVTLNFPQGRSRGQLLFGVETREAIKEFEED